MSYCQISWTIRPSQENDLLSISQIFMQGFAQSIDHYVGTSSQGVIKALCDLFTSLLEYNPQGFLVAVAGERIAGYVIAVPNMKDLWWHILRNGHLWHWVRRWIQGEYGIGLVQVLALTRNKLGFALTQFRAERNNPKLKGHIAQILSIAVHPDYRGLGIGRELLDKAIGYLATTSATVVKLEVRPANVPARRLYEGMGFESISTFRDAQGLWIVMHKPLH